EVHGVNYYFLTDEEFRRHISDDAFVEYEEVYPGRFYGTLKSEIARITGEGHNVILDIDVKGGVNVKKMFGDEAISIFIKPPSVEALRQRLLGRATDSMDAIEQRVSKAEYEISFAPEFDVTVVNDDLAQAIEEIETVIKKFVAA
ncbi:MAG: guanylate kinase, partial [Duncaniella sp.]|nr:guanylate kinase [Duncaniella sp.]